METTIETMTIRHFLEEQGERVQMTMSPGFGEELGEELRLDLVEFGDGENYLRLVRQRDGRIDLIDQGCSDTDSDIGDDPASELKDHVREWIECVYSESELEADVEAGAPPEVSCHSSVVGAIPPWLAPYL